MVYNCSSESMVVTDPNGIVADINPAFTKTTGYEACDIIGQPISILKSGLHDSAFYTSMWQAIVASGQWQGEVWNRRQNGEIYPEWLSINAVYNDNGSIFRLVALFTDRPIMTP
jgi:PAS domain S-box-containing protein